MNKKIIALLSTVSMFAVNAAFAATAYIIPPDPDQTSTLVLHNADMLTVGSTGSIDTSGLNYGTNAVDVSTGRIVSIANSGLIKAAGAAGIYIDTNASVRGVITNEATGHITSINSGLNNLYGIFTAVSTGITNGIFNSGAISANSTNAAKGVGIQISQDSGTITNDIAGIIAASDVGIYLVGLSTISGDIINKAGGQIIIIGNSGSTDLS